MLFSKTDTVDSSFSHDLIMQAGGMVDPASAQQYAEKVVRKAVQHVGESRRRMAGHSVGVPTWTGRAGHAGMPGRSGGSGGGSGRSSNSSGSGGGGRRFGSVVVGERKELSSAASADLLAGMRQRTGAALKPAAAAGQVKLLLLPLLGLRRLLLLVPVVPPVSFSPCASLPLHHAYILPPQDSQIEHRYAQDLEELRRFLQLSPNGVESDRLIGHFGARYSGHREKFVFREMLRRIAVLRNKKWVLKREFQR